MAKCLNSIDGADPVDRQGARRWKRPLFAVSLAAILICLPLVLNDYVQFVVNTMVVYSLVAVGFNVVLGYLGQLAFASAALFGIGAYSAGLSMVHLGIPLPVALLFAGVAGCISGALVGLPALRVQGHYLAIFTLAIGELMRWVYVHADQATFGPSGFNVPQAAFLSFAGSAERSKYYLFLLVAFLGIGATSRLLRSRFGRSFVAVRNNERAAASLGISVARTKIVAFAWSSLILGLAGGLFAVLSGRVTPDSFGLSQMLLHFAIVMIGGLGSLVGSVVSAVSLTAAPELLRNAAGLEEILFSLLLIGVLLFMPKGLGGMIASRIPFFRERLHRK